MNRLDQQIKEELLYKLYNKNVIACGTGKAGKIVIPYLKQDTHIRLCGVTNSRVAAEESGTFLDMGIPIRSIEVWAQIMPDATVLVTATALNNQNILLKILQKFGFKEIILLSTELVDAIAYAQINSYAAVNESFLNQCEEWSRAEANPLLSVMCLTNEIYNTHKATFSEFRACHLGRTVAVVGTGPSMSFYTPLEGVPHIGVNKAYMRKDLKLDFYFTGHYSPEMIDELKNYHFVKFFSYHHDHGFNDEFPQYVVEENHARRYFLGYPGKIIHTNIEYYPLMAFGSIIFSAIHFALYTRAKKILLIGCDCSDQGYFIKKDIMEEFEKAAVPLWIEGYRRVKEYVEHYYPDVEFISVNPVGLKGMFHDMYTENWLDAHSEINRSECEILDPVNIQENNKQYIRSI